LLWLVTNTRPRASITRFSRKVLGGICATVMAGIKRCIVPEKKCPAVLPARRKVGTRKGSAGPRGRHLDHAAATTARLQSMIYRCVDKALAAGVQMGLKDKYHRPHDAEITDEAKAWVVSIACTKPKDHGLAAELWTISALARFVSAGAEAAGSPAWPTLARAPCGASSTRTRSSLTRSATTWKSETRILIARCRKS
jgi:hypothetical protein